MISFNVQRHGRRYSFRRCGCDKIIRGTSEINGAKFEPTVLLSVRVCIFANNAGIRQIFPH